MTQFQTFPISLAVMAFVMIGTTFAQQRDGKTVARIVFHQDVEVERSNPHSQSVKGALEALKQETRQLQTSIRDASAPGSSGQQSIPQNQRLTAKSGLPNLRPSPTPSNETNKLGNTADIDERIELLKRIYENNRTENQRKISGEKHLMSAKRPQNPGHVESTLREEQDVPETLPESVPPNSEPIDTPLPQPQAPNASRVFPDPVNAFELGNSLFQTNELQTALEAYSQVDRNEVTAAESVWLDFMIASCHRRLGDWDAAASLYRDVANQNAAQKLSKPSQRWLKQLEMISRSKSTIAAMDAEIESLIEKAKKHVQQ